MKGKLTVLDLRAEVANLSRRVVGMRVSNVYDYNAKTYMLKLARTDEKIFVLLESGVRFEATYRHAHVSCVTGCDRDRLHTTAYARDKSYTPSGFTMKLRKHIRTRRVESVRYVAARSFDPRFESKAPAAAGNLGSTGWSTSRSGRARMSFIYCSNCTLEATLF